MFNDGRLQRYYAESDYLIYPSIAERGEASPLTPLEAMAKGCIPIVSDMRCYSDYLIDQQNGFVYPLEGAKTYMNLARLLMRLPKTADQRERVREACIATAGNYTVEEIAGRYISDFNAMLKGNPTILEGIRTKEPV